MTFVVLTIFRIAFMSSKIDSHLYIWPESEQLVSALKSEQSFQIYIKPQIKFSELLVDKLAQSVSRLNGKLIERPTVSNDFTGLKSLIVSF